MNPLSWVRESFKRTVRSSHTQAVLQESSDLLAVKRQLVEFTQDLDAGRIGEGQKVLHLRPNFMEQELLDRGNPRWKNE